MEAHLWMLDTVGGRFRQFTSSEKTDKSPEWAPDGRALAFLSNRGGQMQVYLIPAHGGEASAITSSSDGVSDFHWSPDGTQIAYLAKQAEAEPKPENDAQVADRQEDLERLWVVDVGSKKARQVTNGAWRIDEFVWAGPDRFIATASNQPKAESWNGDIYNIAVADGRFSLFSEPSQPFAGLAISRNRMQLSFVSTHANGPIPHDLFLQSTTAGAAQDATSPLDRAVIETKWQNDSTVVVSVIDGFRNRIYRIDSNGVPTAIDLPYSVRAFDMAPDGTLAFVGVAFNHLPELFLKRTDGSVQQVSHLQEGWEGVRLADAELLRFKSFDGTEIEAALMKPFATAMTGKLPLVLLVHGGPASNFSSDYFWFNAWAQLLAARGYEVLMVNPRGSAGYGEAFLKANRADWGGGDFKDLMAAVDFVLARGQTDSARLGIAGWSYGGEMTEWAITQTNRFKAAVAGGGVFDQAAEFGTESSPADDEWYFGNPWDHPEVFARNSPASYVRNARTPTLIVHGEEDRNNPVGQSIALYRALKHYDVETQLVIYPGEGHLPRQEKHQIDILERMLGWFDRYLK